MSEAGHAAAGMATGYTGTFHGRAEEASRVRREITGYLRGCPVTDDIVLIASELAANGILHTRSRGDFFRSAARCPPGRCGSRSRTWAGRGASAGKMTGRTG